MIELFLDLEIAKDLLGKPVIHAENMIYDLDTCDSQTEDGLREQFLQVRGLYALRRLKVLVPR